MKNLLSVILISIQFSNLFAQTPTFIGAGGTGNAYSEWLLDASTNINGTTFSIGKFQGTVNFDPSGGTYNLTSTGEDLFIRSTSNNMLNWVQAIPGNASNLYGCLVSADPFGNVVVAGIFSDTIDFDPGPGVMNIISEGQSDFFIIKFSSNGSMVWVKTIGGIYSDDVYALTTDAFGNVYTSGRFAATVDFDPGAGVFSMTAPNNTSHTFINKLNSNGDFVWTKQIGGVSGNNSEGKSIATDGPGDIYLSGHFRGTVDFDPGAGVFNMATGNLTNSNIFITKLNTAGDLIWAKSFDGPDYEQIVSLKPDVQGNVYLTGTINGQTDFDPGAATFYLSTTGSKDVFVAKLDALGNFNWAKQVGSANTEECYDLVVDDAGNSIVSGSFFGTVDFDPGSGNLFMTCGGSIESFILKLNNAGNLTWATHLGGTGAAECHVISLSLDGSHHLHTAGVFYETCDFDPTPSTFNLTSAGFYDVFISELSQCTNSISTISPIACDFYNSPSGNYTWTTGGTYTDTIPNAAGCDSIITINLTVSSGPMVNLGPDITLCQGDIIQLNAGAGITYLWSSGQTTQSISVSQPGVYSVTVSAFNGCTGTDAVTVIVNPVPNPPITGFNIICAGSSTAFCVNGLYSCYLWSTGANTQCINVNTAGAYTVTVCDMNGCTGTATTVLTVNPLPSPVITGNNSICQGAFSNFNAGAGYATYQWSTGANTQIISVNAAGSYTVTVSDGNGCTGSATETLNVTPNPLPTITGDSTLCPGQSTFLDAGAGYANYIWSTSATTQGITISTFGIYTVTVSNANACTGSASITISAAPPYPTILTASGPLGICLGDSVQLFTQTPMSSFQWHKNNVPIVGATTSSLWVSVAGRYKCVSIDSNSCLAESNQLRVSIVCFPPPPPVDRLEENEFSSLEILVFPNPNNGAFSLTFNKKIAEPFEINIFDLSGKKIMNTSAEYQLPLNLTLDKPGYYLLEILFADGKKFRKPVVVI